MILLDLESRSRCDLKRRGGRNYWAHPSTEVLCAVWYDTARAEVGKWEPGDPRPRWAGAHAVDLAAHNAMGFDRYGCERVFGVSTDPARWVDTSELARKAGLPGSLDALAKRWLGLEKDHAASRFTVSLSSVRRPRDISRDVWRTFNADAKREHGKQPELTPDARARVLAYCASDVEIMAYGWEQLEPWRDVDAETSAVERVINDRGIAFDSELAERLLACDRVNAERVLRAEARAIGWSPRDLRAAANSPEQFATLAGTEDAQAKTVAALVERTDEIGSLARARQALASIARGKLEAGLARVSDDGRLRDTHRYYGGHTGRWSQYGMQLHNMKRPAKEYEGQAVTPAADAVLAGKHASQSEIDWLLRACLYAERGLLAVCDFSGVEARALAWCAGDHKALDTFASGRDPYKVAAATIFGCGYDAVDKAQRQVGKIAELALGYGMGWRKFAATAADAGSDLDALGLDAGEIVSGWRKLHAPIVRFWHALEDGLARAIDGTPTWVDRFQFVPADDGSGVAAFLPSGRPVVYNGARVSVEKGPYGPRRLISYDGTRWREKLYGGKIAENLIQALCRDLLADALVRAERAGLRPVLHVHDEIVCEVDRESDYQELHSIMTTLPEWAETFPIAAAGHVERRYRK